MNPVTIFECEMLFHAEQFSLFYKIHEIIDHKRLTFFFVQSRYEEYKRRKKQGEHIISPLDSALTDFGIESRQTYYNWYELYYLTYKQCKKMRQINV